MRRRDFLGTAAAAAFGGTAAQSGPSVASEPGCRPSAFDVLPNTIAGMSLKQLRDDCRDRLFNGYLPFWDRGGYDKQLGGFTCELNDDGSVFRDEKYIWYQVRAILVYCFLYQHFGKDKRFLEIARKTRDFMVRHMHAGGGRWHDKVCRDGAVIFRQQDKLDALKVRKAIVEHLGRVYK